ncbi:MAG TPA: FHA domain-containing protein, partial [Gemmataceae bacterium]|nr:FHA domain-containing protein [Gemmataceae bacterium]
MKVRLSIGNGSGEPEIFEHAGPLVRIGRDESCELTLESAGGSAVSRQHAQVVLGSKGATLADAGSSNGTLLNGTVIDRATPLHVGDRIQLGYTGPSLTVLELDLTPGAAVEPPSSRQMLLYGSIAGGAVAVVALAIVLLIVLRKPETP